MRVASAAMSGKEIGKHHRVERHRIAGITRARNRVQADDLAGQKKSLHLLAALAVGHVGFYRAGTYRGDGID